MIGKSSLAVATVVAVIGTAGAAQALRTGSYVGTSHDGSNISLTINGPFPYTIGAMNVAFVAPCPKTGQTATEGWGFYLGTPITASGADFESHNDYYYIDGNLHFQDSKTIVGNITSRTSVFVQGVTPPAAAMFCKSPLQQFTLIWQGPQASPPAASAVVLQPKRKNAK